MFLSNHYYNFARNFVNAEKDTLHYIFFAGGGMLVCHTFSKFLFTYYNFYHADIVRVDFKIKAF